LQIVSCLIVDLNSEMTLLVTWDWFITVHLTSLPSITISDATDCVSCFIVLDFPALKGVYFRIYVKF
jgi:hypothetical protein